MNVVQALSHSIEEHDMLKMYARIGVDAFSLGGYIDPRSPHDDKRPAVPEMAFHPELKAAVDGIGVVDNLTAAQHRIPEAVLDWADVIVYHHYLDRLYGQWDRIRRWLDEDSAHRVIWRTVGQSVEGNERDAQPFHNDGMEIVRYSPKERNIPGYAGESALIRFSKDPAEWYGWTGDWTVYQYDGRSKDDGTRFTNPVVGATGKGVPFVGNVTQDLPGRDPYTNYGFWKDATQGLPAVPAGPGSEHIGGLGSLSYEMMQKYLRGCRAYLYTGTQPASYTLGLIEAMMTGVPVVSIGPEHMQIFPYGPSMFEGHEIVQVAERSSYSPEWARGVLETRLNDPEVAQLASTLGRERAIELFGSETIDAQWKAYLG